MLRLLTFVLLSTAAFGQQFSTRNPLDELKDQVAKVLVEAGVPFTDQQDKALALFVEEQRQSSEELFGVIMDFRGGPPQGADRDRALAGIQWMHDEFKKKLPAFLTEAQRAAWEKSETTGKVIAARVPGAGERGARKEQIQQVRINNNPFTADERNTGFGGNAGGRGGGGGTQVIQRGGSGAFHGNFSSNFQDESLNARNPFANNKPPYFERTLNGNFSGPLLRNRLTVNLAFSDNHQENVGTVKAVLLSGPYSLGVTNPNTNRSGNASGILQLSEAHSLHFGVRWGMNDRKNQGVQGFRLPERGFNGRQNNFNSDLKHIAILSPRTVHETRFNWQKGHDENTPKTRAFSINVLDAFFGGGGQNRTASDGQTYEVGNLLYYTGEKWTFRSGFDGTYRRETSLNENNFLGEFTFSRLTCPKPGDADYDPSADCRSYENQRPTKYRVTRGDPRLFLTLTQIGLFIQNDLKVSPRFTLMMGLRYEAQSHLSDHNNLDPRIAFAFALGSSTVVRGGAGVFSQRLPENIIQDVLRLDGKRQYEIVIDNPGWPDPFLEGATTINPPASRRVRSPDLRAPYNAQSQLSLERSLPRNLFLNVTFDFNRGVNMYRNRNLNAPLPGSGLKPYPIEGHVYQLEATGRSSAKNLRVGMRQRFSIFNVTGNYTLASVFNDVDGAGGMMGNNLILPADNYNLKADWGRAGFAQKHSFNASVNSRLPFGVFLTTAVIGNSGGHYNVTTGKDDNGDSQFNDRPEGVPRNSGHGPSFFNVNFNLSKAFSLHRAVPGEKDSGGGPQMNVFINASNALNMTNFGMFSGVMTSPFFGKPTSARQAREIEAGMRFQF